MQRDPPYTRDTTSNKLEMLDPTSMSAMPYIHPLFSSLLSHTHTTTENTTYKGCCNDTGDPMLMSTGTAFHELMTQPRHQNQCNVFSANTQLGQRAL